MGPQLESTEANFYFSPSELVFVAGILKKDYVKAGSWPKDARPVSDEIYAAFIANPPEGKVRGADDAGMPCWEDAPPPAKAQLIEMAQRKLSTLMTMATKAIAPLQDAVELGIATDSEKVLLNDWKRYRVMLNRIDISVVPDIEWPLKPE
nr:tail fiber assembly protein [Serratia sp. PAMC26656]MBJ7892360.1 tail fiber assembly protein [Serratia sp. PAMC26656]